jgi:hypothetical protein
MHSFQIFFYICFLTSALRIHINIFQKFKGLIYICPILSDEYILYHNFFQKLQSIPSDVADTISNRNSHWKFIYCWFDLSSWNIYNMLDC